MNQISTTGMEPHIKSRYEFAMSSFARMYGVKGVLNSPTIPTFCIEWAHTSKDIPEGSLTTVDFYFRDLWTMVN
jgi:hypothetical protein